MTDLKSVEELKGEIVACEERGQLHEALLRVPPALDAATSTGASPSAANRFMSPLATAVAISACTAKISLRARSKICDQLLKPVPPSMTSTVTRTSSPARRTLP